MGKSLDSATLSGFGKKMHRLSEFSTEILASTSKSEWLGRNLRRVHAGVIRGEAVKVGESWENHSIS